MTENYDKDTVDKYVEYGGSHCPECNTELDNLVSGRLEDEGDGTAIRSYRCIQCKATWFERYILDDCIPENHGQHHNQQPLFGSNA